MDLLGDSAFVKAAAALFPCSTLHCKSRLPQAGYHRSHALWEMWLGVLLEFNSICFLVRLNSCLTGFTVTDARSVGEREKVIGARRGKWARSNGGGDRGELESSSNALGTVGTRREQLWILAPVMEGVKGE